MYKAVCKIKNSNGNTTITKINSDTYLVLTEGISDKDSLEKTYQTLVNLSKGKKINMITDNSKIKSIDPEARKTALKFGLENSPFKKIASVNNSIIMKGFIKLYSTLASKKIKFNTFSTIEEAIKWIEK